MELSIPCLLELNLVARNTAILIFKAKIPNHKEINRLKKS